MKKLFAVAVALSVVGLASQASADIIGTTTTSVVGGIDQMIAAGTSASAHDDAAFLNEAFGLSLTSEYIENFRIESLDWYSVSDGAPDEYAFDLPRESGWFLVKTETSVDGYDRFLFENDPSSSWATVVLGGTYEDVQGYSKFGLLWLPVGLPVDITLNMTDIEAISRVTPIGRGAHGAPVPEPATLLLLGAGMAGLAAARRKR